MIPGSICCYRATPAPASGAVSDGRRFLRPAVRNLPVFIQINIKVQIITALCFNRYGILSCRKTIDAEIQVLPGSICLVIGYGIFILIACSMENPL